MMTLNNFIKIFISSHLLILQVSAAVTDGQTRVVGGMPTSIHFAPYMVQLYKDGKFHCGGALIKRTKVLTAAHCVDGIDASSFVVVGGATALADPSGATQQLAEWMRPVQVGVKKIMIPTAYNKDNKDADVAVMKLAKRLTGRLIRTINISTRNFKHGDLVQLFGWGKRMDHTDYTTTVLHTTWVNVIDSNWCRDTYAPYATISEKMFCAGAPGKSSCYGDSGSPVLVNGELSGVVSWGIECGRTNFPAVYTQLSQVMPFIAAALEN